MVKEQVVHAPSNAAPGNAAHLPSGLPTAPKASSPRALILFTSPVGSNSERYRESSTNTNRPSLSKSMNPPVAPTVVDTPPVRDRTVMGAVAEVVSMLAWPRTASAPAEESEQEPSRVRRSQRMGEPVLPIRTRAPPCASIRKRPVPSSTTTRPSRSTQNGGRVGNSSGDVTNAEASETGAVLPSARTDIKV
jgi:hypothetical protein